MKPGRVSHLFVEYVPEELDPATLYISIEYATIVHACLCGCGSRIVTPLSPTDWAMSYDGATISLAPSIGNWSFACQSHYWIVRGRVRWSRRLSAEKIQAGRDRDRREKEAYYAEDSTATAQAPVSEPPRAARSLLGFFAGPEVDGDPLDAGPAMTERVWHLHQADARPPENAS